MKKIVMWFGIITGGVLGVIIVLIGVLFVIGSMKVNRTYDVEGAFVSVPTDDASIARAKHYIEAIAQCQECHGDNLAGKVLEDDPGFGKLVPRNLTSGRGGIGGDFTDEDYVRAIRHGIGRDEGVVGHAVRVL